MTADVRTKPVGPIRGVVFDLDGTLVNSELDFEAMRREIGLPAGTPLLEAVDRMAGAEREAALQVLHRHEEIAARSASVHPGVAGFLGWLEKRGVRRAVLSRNMRSAVETVLQRWGLSFDLVLAREDAPYKPNPEGLWQICTAWGMQPREVLMVGDHLFDIQVGHNAGTWTALVTYGNCWPYADQADYVFSTFEAIPDALRTRLEGLC